MKTKLIVKLIIVLPFILMIDYIIMVLLGCASCLFGTGENFQCNSYCIIGKSILLLSALLFGYYISDDVKAMMRKFKHGAPTEK